MPRMGPLKSSDQPCFNPQQPRLNPYHPRGYPGPPGLLVCTHDQVQVGTPPVAPQGCGDLECSQYHKALLGAGPRRCRWGKPELFRTSAFSSLDSWCPRDSTSTMTSQAYSGKLVLRLPRDLHARCVERAGQEGCSLNAFLVQAVSGAIGDVKPEKPKESRKETEPEGPACTRCGCGPGIQSICRCSCSCHANFPEAP